MLESHATVEPVEEDRALANGDWAEIQFNGEIKDLAQTVTEDGRDECLRSMSRSSGRMC